MSNFRTLATQEKLDSLYLKLNNILPLKEFAQSKYNASCLIYFKYEKPRLDKRNG